MERNNTIDFIRLIAAFAIMNLHTSLPSFGFEYNAIIRLSSRWAIPVFFIITGYFLGFKITSNKKLEFKKIEKNIVNLISVLFVSSIIYFFVQFIISDFWFNNEIGFLGQGTYWHLWFIGSMILAYVFIWYIYYIEWSTYLWLISIFILLLALFSDSYDVIANLQIDYNKIPRFLISIPFMYIGILISKINIDKVSIFVVALALIAGFVIQFVELVYFKIIYDYNIYDHQILFGIIISTISVFMLSLKVKLNSNIISRLGKRYSLFIYLYHIIVYFCIYKIINFLGVSEDIRVIFPLTAFILTLLIAIVLDKYVPRVFSVLSGSSYKNK